jgi:myosin-5
MVHSYDVGTRAWQPDLVEGWISSEVEEKLVEGDKVILVFSLANGEVGQFLALDSLSYLR